MPIFDDLANHPSFLQFSSAFIDIDANLKPPTATMSLKIERDTVQTGPAPKAAPSVMASLTGGPPLPGTSGKHPISAAVGTAITGGKEMAGTKGYLAVRLRSHHRNRRCHGSGYSAPAALPKLCR